MDVIWFNSQTLRFELLFAIAISLKIYKKFVADRMGDKHENFSRFRIFPDYQGVIPISRITENYFIKIFWEI